MSSFFARIWEIQSRMHKKTGEMGRMGGRERGERHGIIKESAAASLRPVDMGKSGHGWTARPKDNGEPPAGGGGNCTGKSAAAGAWCKKQDRRA